MQIIQTEENLDFLPKPNNARFVLAAALPPLERITAAVVLAFEEDRILLTKLRSRGWDLPGGHLEAGETAAAAMERGLYEEAGATVEQVELLGYTHLQVLAAKPEGYRYPYPDSYIVAYWARIATLADFSADGEAAARALFAPAQARQVPWIQGMIELYEIALRRATDRTDD